MPQLTLQSYKLCKGTKAGASGMGRATLVLLQHCYTEEQESIDAEQGM
jgi:hypothetical protein